MKSGGQMSQSPVVSPDFFRRCRDTEENFIVNFDFIHIVVTPGQIPAVFLFT
jgi:hypothetical protein